MAVKIYDDAIVAKLKKWIKDPNLRILKPDETTRFFEMKADLQKDNPLTLPVISISRDRNIQLTDINKQPKTFDGYSIVKNEKTSIPLNVIPISISYQIDIYTKGMEEADEYVRNFVFNLINFPKLEVEIPYQGLNLHHVSNIILDSNISDNSDIREHIFPDQFVRFSIRFQIPDAYLFSLPASQSITFGDVNLDVVKSNLE